MSNKQRSTLNEQVWGGITYILFTRQFRGCKQVGQRAGAPDESPNVFHTVFFIGKEAWGEVHLRLRRI